MERERSRVRKAIKVLKVMIVLAIMACIFYLSSQTSTDSKVLSDKVLEQLKEYYEIVTCLVPFINKINRGYPQVHIRKIAHFVVYLILGFVSYLVLPKHWSVRRKMACVVSLCFIYAITDEIHQYFVPGRGPQVRDVLIDTLGGSVGMSIGCLIKRFK